LELFPRLADQLFGLLGLVQALLYDRLNSSRKVRPAARIQLSYPEAPVS
jgi:hypothetical protein